MLISVVIPAYNAENWIAETLGSVLAQTYRQLEILIVDDGSTDRTVACAEFFLRNSPLPYQIIRQQNAGAAAARNRGWKLAKGDWIQFLDADDLIDPKKIELQATTILNVPSTDLVYSDWQKLIWLDGSWRAHDQRRPRIKSDALADLLSDRNFLQLGCMLVRRGVVEAVGGFDSAHEPIEDVGLCIKIAIAKGKFTLAQSDQPVASYRDLPRSFSKINHTRFVESCIKNGRLVEQYISAAPEHSARTIDAIVDLYFVGARYFAETDRKRFDEVVSDIERLRPGFVPSTPAQLKWLSRIAGYRRAEQLAVIYRKAKRLGARRPSAGLSL
jgi:glycosyltransferase involved in cell wall biosynthesis